MPSASLQTWRSQRQHALDEIEDAHRSIGGSGPGRRYATQQINQAYVVLLSSQFQAFCRDLHSECTDLFVQGITPADRRLAIRRVFAANRKLDFGNPNPGNIGSDFNRFGINFWGNVSSIDVRNQDRQKRLEELMLWRNAIAHQDFTSLTGATLHLRQVRNWRSACDHMSVAFDEVLRLRLQSVLGASPW
jgi:hypothetical protein